MKQIQIYLKYELYMSSVYVNGVNIRFIICGMLLCQEKKSITFKMNITQIQNSSSFIYRQENWKSIKPFGSSLQVLLRLNFHRSLMSGLRCSPGRSVGSFPEQQLVIEPSFAWPGQFLFYFFNLVDNVKQ